VRSFLLFALLVLSSALLFADTDSIVLKNGDHYSGTVTKSDGKTVVLKTDAAGEITIKLDAVQEIRTAAPVNVNLNDGKTLVGNLTTSGDTLTVSSPAGGTSSAPVSNIVTVRNADEQAAYEKTLHPPFTQGWAGGLVVGFGLTSGNSETESLNLGMNAERKTTTDDTKLYLTSVYSTNNAPGAVPSTTANTILAGARYDHNLTKNIFGFVNADFQTDELQMLNLRTILGGGVGYHVINNPNTTFDVLGGLNWTHENYDTMTDSFAGLTLGEELTQKLGASTVLVEKGYYLPKLSDFSNYRATFSLGTVTKISKWFGWQNAFGDIYVSQPPAGTKTNDILFTTGLNIAFAH
jgi:putative salt-induced outer membrane protein YdiY